LYVSDHPTARYFIEEETPNCFLLVEHDTMAQIGRFATLAEAQETAERDTLKDGEVITA
jgi:hypothetical protein